MNKEWVTFLKEKLEFKYSFILKSYCILHVSEDQTLLKYLMFGNNYIKISKEKKNSLYFLIMLLTLVLSCYFFLLVFVTEMID